MRLLVSVATPEEASAALAGGADVIDAKDPTFALGAVSLDILHAIHAICAGHGPSRPPWATPTTKQRSSAQRPP